MIKPYAGIFAEGSRHLRVLRNPNQPLTNAIDGMHPDGMTFEGYPLIDCKEIDSCAAEQATIRECQSVRERITLPLPASTHYAPLNDEMPDGPLRWKATCVRVALT